MMTFRIAATVPSVPSSATPGGPPVTPKKEMMTGGPLSGLSIVPAGVPRRPPGPSPMAVKKATSTPPKMTPGEYFALLKPFIKIIFL